MKEDINNKRRRRRWQGHPFLATGFALAVILSIFKLLGHRPGNAVLWEEQGRGAMENRTFLNSFEQEKIRWDKAVTTKVTSYATQDLEGSFYLKLLLRATTGALVERLPEPFVNKKGKRDNGGCFKLKCMLHWDGWARAMATGDALLDVLNRGVPGAVAEVGVYKGGMSAYLQGILLLTGEAVKGREMWLIDSFKGMPPTDLWHSHHDSSNSDYNSPKGQDHWIGKFKTGGVAEVANNLDRLGLMDAGNVHFLEGWVNDTLPDWNVTELSFLRIDVDIYSATYDALHFLYPRLSVGGAVLFDDWKLPYARDAAINYREQHGITTPVQFLDGCFHPMAYWIKE